MDSDKIIVLDDGAIVELDSPYKLLKKENGHLRNLVDKMGVQSALNLEQIASDHYNSIKKDKIL